jgi:acetyl esterase/lipase
MRKLVLSLSGMAAAAAGMLIVQPRIERFDISQIVLNEVPWLPAATGAAVAAASAKGKRSSLGLAFGTMGAALSAVPLTQIRATLRDLERSMCEGFGADYEQHIPAEALRRASPEPFSLMNTLGAHLRQSPVRQTDDVPYAVRPTRKLHMDIYQPPESGDKSYPAVLVLHGGGWRNGDKGVYFAPIHRYIASQGYVVFDAQYRFTQEARWPAQLEDVRDALRWIRANAAAYEVDPQRIVLMGRSAGGHLALQAAYRALDDYTDTNVSGVIAYYAPTNLKITGAEHDERVVALTGGTSYEFPDIYTDASPLEFAQGAHLPPTLLIHGYHDDVVSPVHTELLLNRLRLNRTPAAALRLPWARHGFDAVMIGIGAQMTQYYVDRFLAWSVNR